MFPRVDRLPPSTLKENWAGDYTVLIQYADGYQRDIVVCGNIWSWGKDSFDLNGNFRALVDAKLKEAANKNMESDKQ